MSNRIYVELGVPYQYDSSKSGIVSIGQAVDKGVQRVSALDIIVDACYSMVRFLFPYDMMACHLRAASIN